MKTKQYWLRGLIIGFFIGELIFIGTTYIVTYLNGDLVNNTNIFLFVYKLLFKTMFSDTIAGMFVITFVVVCGVIGGIVGLFSGFLYGKANKQKYDLPRNS